MGKWTLKVLATGKTEFGQWVLGYLSDDIILYYGICQLDKDYSLEKDKIYPVKTIDVSQNRKNKLIIKLGL